MYNIKDLGRTRPNIIRKIYLVKLAASASHIYIEYREGGRACIYTYIYTYTHIVVQTNIFHKHITAQTNILHENINVYNILYE